MKKKFLLFLIISSLNACATTANYEKKLSLELDKTEQQLIAAWGKPNQIKQQANGDKILIYTFINHEVLPISGYYDMSMMDEDEIFAPFTYGGNIIPDGNFLGENITDYCQTKFYLTNNRVTSWQYKGNACVAL